MILLMANSNKHVDVALRYAYRDENIGCCEIAWGLGLDWTHGRVPSKFPRFVLRIPAHDCHHLWTNPRRDSRSNLICIHRTPHDLVHNGKRGEAKYIRLLAMLAKAVKAAHIKDFREFDIPELDMAAGKSVKGWVECMEIEPCWSWVRPFRSELLERME